MKKIITLAIFWLSVCEIYSQDLLVLRKGDTLDVTIIKIVPDLVEYKYQNEMVVNLIAKKQIHKIIFSSGRIEVFNEKKDQPIIKGKGDWEKVIITFDENDITGLTECGTIVGKSDWGGIASIKGGENAMREMKKEAAEIGASIILITEGWHKEKNKPISGYGRGVKITGKIYK